MYAVYSKRRSVLLMVNDGLLRSVTNKKKKAIQMSYDSGSDKVVQLACRELLRDHSLGVWSLWLNSWSRGHTAPALKSCCC